MASALVNYSYLTDSESEDEGDTPPVTFSLPIPTLSWNVLSVGQMSTEGAWGVTGRNFVSNLEFKSRDFISFWQNKINQSVRASLN